MMNKKNFWIILLLMFFMTILSFGYIMGFYQSKLVLKNNQGVSFNCYKLYEEREWIRQGCNANITMIGYNYTINIESNFDEIKLSSIYG